MVSRSPSRPSLPDSARRRGFVPGVLFVLAACAGPRPNLQSAPEPSVDIVSELASAALIADAHLDPADSLYFPDVEIIAEGRRRTGVPRFAGIDTHGQVVVGSTRVDMSGDFAWAVVEYRWLATGENIIREGRATLVFARARGGRRWLIAHAHSSLVR